MKCATVEISSDSDESSNAANNSMDLLIQKYSSTNSEHVFRTHYQPDNNQIFDVDEDLPNISLFSRLRKTKEKTAVINTETVNPSKNNCQPVELHDEDSLPFFPNLSQEFNKPESDLKTPSKLSNRPIVDLDKDLPNISLFSRLRKNKEKTTANRITTESVHSLDSNNQHVELQGESSLPSGQNFEEKIDLTLSTESGSEQSKYSFEQIVSQNGNESLLNVDQKTRKRKTSEEQITEKAKKATEKMQIRAEKENAKKILLQEKALKKASLFAQNSLKPGECMKYITVNIDSDLTSNEFYDDLITALQTAQIKFNVSSQIIPSSITWTREIQNVFVGNETPTVNSTLDEENVVLLIMNWTEIVELIARHDLHMNLATKQSILSNKKISIGIYGLDRYFKYWKNQRKNIQKKNRGESSTATNKNSLYENLPKISPNDLETQLTKLQILTRINHRTVETAAELSSMILQYTKAIAEAPFKAEKQLKEQQTDWYVRDSNRDCVRVDKFGNGLARVWQQQLTQFNLARLETAEAILVKYPSPASLMEAYENCSTVQEGEQLLQDLPIRRAAGPLTTLRKIGPELSKKIYNFFTNLHGDSTL